MDMSTSRGKRANGPDSEWLELLVKNVKDELQRQVARVREAGDPKPPEEKQDNPEVNNWQTRAGNARTLAVLTSTLDRLGRLEQQLARAREIKARRNDDKARTALERRLDKLLDGGAAPKRPRKSE
jgi:small-conductance mechanosensitive channel